MPMIAKKLHPHAEPFYIESDGTPMGETPLHIQNMVNTIVALNYWFRNDPMAYIGGNMFVHYERGNRNKHLSPDIFVVRGVPKITNPRRRSYRVWEDNKAPDFVLELTSKSTARDDLVHKRAIYQNIMKVKEYFLFDPFEEHLTPPLQGYRLENEIYERIEPIEGRLPSQILGLQLEATDEEVRLFDPVTKVWLRTPEEVQTELEASEAERLRNDKALKKALAQSRREAKAREEAEAAKRRSEAEVERLRRELAKLRKKGSSD